MHSLVERKPPENQASAKAIAMIRNNSELGRSVKNQLSKISKEFKCEEEMQAVLSAVDDTISMAEYVENILAPLHEKKWDGTITPQERKMLEPGYFNYQDLLVKKKLQEIDKDTVAEKMQNVVMIYDINDKSEFVRAYVSNGKQLDVNNSEEKKLIDLYDQCFHSWLVYNKMSSQSGVIFNTSKLDRKGNYIERATPDDVIKLINNPERGLDIAVKKLNKSFSLGVQRNQQKPEQDISVRAETNV